MNITKSGEHMRRYIEDSSRLMLRLIGGLHGYRFGKIVEETVQPMCGGWPLPIYMDYRQ